MKKTYYRHLDYWKRYQEFLPEVLRFEDGKYPDEDWWEWNGNSIHLDFMRNPTAKVKFILLHGGGGNGRLLSTYGVCLHRQGYEYIAPDFPGFGLTAASPVYRRKYTTWVDLVSDLVDRESQRDNRPIILLGASIGGMLAYHTACKNKKVKGIIATCLADSRKASVRDVLAKNKLWSRAGYFFMTLFPFITGHVNIRASWIANMKHITNDSVFSEVFIQDPFSGRSKINAEFYRSMTEYKPVIEPENFYSCPVLLVHPEIDKWTPFEISKKFFDKIAGEKRFVLLEGTGHYPYETPGLGQMIKAVEDFVRVLL